MKSERSPRLTLLLPWLVLGVFAALVSLLVWERSQTIESQHASSSVRFVTQDLASLQYEMDERVQLGQLRRAGHALSSRAIDTNYDVLVALDERGWIDHATRNDLIGREGANHLPEFEVERFDRVRQTNRADVRYEPARQRISAYFPLALERQADEIRPSRVGALFAIYDLTADHAQTWARAWRPSMLLSALVVIAVMTLIASLHQFVTRPVRHLVAMAQAVAEGEPGALVDIRGNGELAVIGNAFNEMSRQLEVRFRQNQEVAEALRKSEAFLNATGRTARVGGWEFDIRTLKLDWTAETYRICGIPFGEVTSREDAKQIFHPDDRAVIEQINRRAIEDGEPYDIESRFVTGEGQHRWAHTICKPVMEDGKTVRLTGTFQDITERKRAEEKLRQYEHIVSSSSDMLALFDRRYVCLATNESHAKALGKTSDEVVGRTLADLVGDDFFEAAVRSRVDRCLAGEEVRWQGPFDSPADGLRYVDIACFPYTGTDGRAQGFVLAGRDITEERERADQLRQSQKMEAIGLLAGGVAHDFNNSLLVILGHIELALEAHDPSQSLRANLIAIRTAAEHSANLTRQLLGFARKQPVARRELDLNGTVEDILEMISRLIGEAIEIVWLPGEGLWRVKMDPSQIDQILTNLCVNARDAIEDTGKVTIETANVTLDEAYCAKHLDSIAGDYVRLTVRDNGHGMDEDALSRLYEPFFTTKALGEGTGLGLATVYGIVKQNDGSINVRSGPNAGTDFEIYLPRHTASTSTSRVEEESQAEATAQSNECILLVEDDAAILNLITKALERHGYRLLCASTPEQALRLAGEHAGEIHLLLTDVIMPKMDGRRLAKELRSTHPNLELLFMSGYTADAIGGHEIAGAEVPFIQKPFRTRDLIAKVRATLKHRAHRNETPC